MQETLPLDIIIDFRNCRIWQQDHLVLSDVNMSVGKGEFMYLVGKGRKRKNKSDKNDQCSDPP